MNIVNYLADTYGYDTPIFLKDLRIGGKSKAAIKESLYRASKNGQIEKKKNGVYFLRSNKEFGSGIGFEDVFENKFIYKKDANYDFKELFTIGYYSGQTFLNRIGISNQVPMVLEITTNNTSSKKRFYTCGRAVAIIRKARTEVTFQNYKILQLLDMFYFLTMDEVKDNRELIRRYIKKQQITKFAFSQYIGLYSDNTLKKLVEGEIIDAFV